MRSLTLLAAGGLILTGAICLPAQTHQPDEFAALERGAGGFAFRRSENLDCQCGGGHARTAAEIYLDREHFCHGGGNRGRCGDFLAQERIERPAGVFGRYFWS